MAEGTVRLRLLHDGAGPASGEPCVFGLQNAREEIRAGAPAADGRLAFEFELRVKDGPDPARPVFLGDYAMGPPAARFVYLSWKHTGGAGGYIGRLKAQLGGVTWAQVREAQATGRALTADMTGRSTGSGKGELVWTVA